MRRLTLTDAPPPDLPPDPPRLADKVIGQGGGQTAIVLALGAVLVLLLILFIAMAINDQKSRLKQIAADAQAALDPPAPPPAPAPAPTVPHIPPSTAQPERRFPLEGTDGANRPAPKAEPTGNPASWFSHDDYPIEALRRNEQGRVQIRLKIDPLGEARACAIISSSGSVALDDATCALALRRSRFVPARRADGRAVWGSWTSGIRWQLTDEG